MEKNEAKILAWTALLREIFNGDEAAIALFQSMLGEGFRHQKAVCGEKP